VESGSQGGSRNATPPPEKLGALGRVVAKEFELRRVWLENRGSIMASRETLEKIMAVMKRHLTPSQVRAIVGDLNEEPGDKSFRDTVRAMVAVLEREEQQ
jgi:hypothetical protein